MSSIRFGRKEMNMNICVVSKKTQITLVEVRIAAQHIWLSGLHGGYVDVVLCV